MTFWILLTRWFDAYSTYQYTPDLGKESNPLVSIFGFGWTPCIGPILGSILALAATEESINKGILLLLFYSLGLALPFILSGYLIQKFMIFSKNLKKNMNLITNMKTYI